MAEKLCDAYARGRVDLMESPADISRLLLDFRLYSSGTVMPLLAEARPDDFAIEAIRFAIAGRESEWLAVAAEKNSHRAAKGARAGSMDPIAAKRRAQVDEYIAEVLRVTKKRIFRRDFWKAAGYSDATAFERWQRNDSRSSKADDRAFTRVLTEKPHLINFSRSFPPFAVFRRLLPSF
jgi:hypothetical protein